MTAQELKNSILQWAIQGRLVEQRPEEGTAKELIDQIKAEKEQLIKDKKIKKEKPLPEVTEDEIPFDIPASWKWVRFGELGHYKKGPFGSALTKGMFVPKSENTIKVYEQKNAIQKNANLGEYYITNEYYNAKMKGFEVFPGDIIVSCAGTIGETYIMPEEFEKGIINQALMRMKLMPIVYVEYFLIYFDFILKKTAIKSSKGSAIKNIPPFEELKSYLVAMPPVEEQKRIVAKIEELMSYVEQYDQAYTKLEVFNKKFPEDMQKSILQYAIQGKLVEQRAEEGTAEELYQQIQEEKARLIKEGKIKKEKPLPEIAEDEIPFDIPESWKWVRLQQIGELNRGKSKHRPRNDIRLFEDGTFPLIQTGDVARADGVIKEYKTMYNEFGVNQSRIWKKGTVCLTIAANIGDVAMLGFDACFPDSVVGFNAYEPITCNKYFLYGLMSYKNILDKMSRSTAQKNINLDILSKIAFPLPPLEEQKRIVAKIEEMLPYCQQLIK